MKPAAVRSAVWAAMLPATAGVALVLAALGAPQSPPTPTRLSIEASGRELVTSAAQGSIDRGLAWLAVRQHEDGSFGSGSNYRQNVAVTALCGMAFLSAGHTPGRGQYGDEVQKAIDFVLSRCEPAGFIVDEASKSHGPMYGHGFATMFLAEVYGMTPREDVREKLDRAVRLIVATQNNEGGWRYTPERVRAADISVTVSQMMALRAARNAGIFVPKETVDNCVAYVRRCQNPDGGFRYMLVGRPDSDFPRSAAALVALYSAGVYEDAALTRGLDYVMRFVPGELFRHDMHYFYGHYYAVQAAWHAGGSHWTRWYPAVRDEMIRRQLPNGAWPDIGITICPEYSTAMALLILQMPNNCLPIFQR